MFSRQLPPAPTDLDQFHQHGIERAEGGARVDIERQLLLEVPPEADVLQEAADECGNLTPLVLQGEGTGGQKDRKQLSRPSPSGPGITHLTELCMVLQMYMSAFTMTGSWVTSF